LKEVGRKETIYDKKLDMKDLIFDNKFIQNINIIQELVQFYPLSTLFIRIDVQELVFSTALIRFVLVFLLVAFSLA
jgi:hypothetical protein